MTSAHTNLASEKAEYCGITSTTKLGKAADLPSLRASQSLGAFNCSLKVFSEGYLNYVLWLYKEPEVFRASILLPHLDAWIQVG